MRNKLLYVAPLATLLCAAALAQPPSDKPAKPNKPEKASKQADKSGKAESRAEGELKLGPTTEAEKLFDELLTKVESLKSYRSELRQTIEMLGYRFVGNGQYALAPDYRMLYELKVELTDTTGTVKEVCDGRFHWHYQNILDSQELRKFDLTKIREILDKPEFKKEIREGILKQWGFSGILPLLQGLRDTHKFDTHEEGTVGDVAVYVFHGQWKEDAINQATFRGQQLTAASIPEKFPYIPSKTTVKIAKDTGWPYEIRMESLKKTQGTATVITLEFLNPQIGVELPQSLFVFEPPPDVRPDDQTEVMHTQLSSALQQLQAAEKRAADSPPPSSGANAPGTAPATAPAESGGLKFSPEKKQP